MLEKVFHNVPQLLQELRQCCVVAGQSLGNGLKNLYQSPCKAVNQIKKDGFGDSMWGYSAGSKLEKMGKFSRQCVQASPLETRGLSPG